MLSNTAIRILRRLLGSPSSSEGPYAGRTTVLDGITAVAVTEAGISESAVFGGTFPAQVAALAWRSEQRRPGGNFAGAPLAGEVAEGPRGALAAAMGQAIAGVRSTVFLSGPDLAGAGDLLRRAVDLRLPLVVHLAAKELQGAESGHQALHLAADAGAPVLVAANVQEAVDFALIARRVAELALVPVVVAMDSTQTALALQDVRLPPASLAEHFPGAPDERIPAPNQAQQLLFGESRRRLPRQHDPDRPALLGSARSGAVAGVGRAAVRTFFADEMEGLLEQACSEYAEHTGRRRGALSEHRVAGAKIILVAQGAALETAEAVADHLGGKPRLKVGVLGVHRLRPFPGAELARLLGSGARVLVLERLETPLAGDPPLLRELRAALDRALENGSFGAECHPGYPVLKEGKRPRLQSVLYGLGGMPLRAADLAVLCREAETINRPRLYLGLAPAPTASAYPKRQVLIDRLRRAYPDLAEQGLHSTQPAPGLLPEGSVTLALQRLSGGPEEGLLAETAALLQGVLEGGVRSRPGLSSVAWGDPCTDLVSAGSEPVRDPGDAPRVDLALLAAGPILPGADLGDDLAHGGALLVPSALPDDALWVHLDADLRRSLQEREAGLYRLPPAQEGAESAHNDYLLGALCGVLSNSGQLEVSRLRLLNVREDQLAQESDAAARLAAFEAGLDGVHLIDPAALPKVPAQSVVEAPAPALVQRLGRIDDAYDSLPRFWDQVGVLYRNGDTRELAPDPYLALGAVPPLSAGFQDLTPLRTSLPLLDPTICTGCGACWSGCPDSALGATAVSPARLLDAGIKQARADALRPVASKLAAGMDELCRTATTRGATAGSLLNAAYERIKEKLPFPAARKAAIARDLEAVMGAVGALQISVTEPFLLDSDSDGELLAIALDADACKDCGICVAVCEPGALQSQRQSAETLKGVRAAHGAWSRLPDTAEQTRQRIRVHPDVGAAAAALLSRSAAATLSGGDGAEPGSGARLALRLALAAAHAKQQPLFAGFLKEAQELHERITTLIREQLANALPADDLDALSRSLEGVETRQAELSAFLGGAAEDVIDSAVDAARLRRLVELARGLGGLARRLEKGRQGMGRAGVGLVLAADQVSGWAAAFPHNPFAGPVTLDATGDGAQLAAGLAEGQLRQTTGDLVLLRKARLELEHPEDAARRWGELERLSWRDLDSEEQALCPSLILVGDSSVLAGRGLSQVAWLLGSDLPVKLLVLAELDLGLAGPDLGLAGRAQLQLNLARIADPAVDLGLLALAQRGACVAQTSLGAPGHLMESLEAALDYRGPALLHLYAPSPARHGFAPELTLTRAREALEARLLPLFRYHPQGEGVFGSRIDLGGNPEPRESWSGDNATTAHWALGEGRFANLFTALAEDAKEPLPLAEYLGLPSAQRAKHTPFVEQRLDDESKRLRVDPRLVQASEERQAVWRMLQELAGEVTPFTERVRREAEAAVADERQAELAAQAADYEAQISALRDQLLEETRYQIRDRLVQMAGYGQPARGADA